MNTLSLFSVTLNGQPLKSNLDWQAVHSCKANNPQAIIKFQAFIRVGGAA